MADSAAPPDPIASRQVLAAEALLRALHGQTEMPLRQALQLAPAGCAEAPALLELLRGLGVQARAEGQNLVLDKPLELLDGGRLAADLEVALEGALGKGGGEVDVGLCLSTSSTNTDVAAWLEQPPGGAPACCAWPNTNPAGAAGGGAAGAARWRRTST